MIFLSKMSNNNKLSSLLSFLSSTVQNVEIPDDSIVTCSIKDAILENQETTQTQSIGEIQFGYDEGFFYTLESVEYICQDCNASFSSVSLHTNHVQKYHVQGGPHMSIGAKNLENLFQNIISGNIQVPMEPLGPEITPPQKDDKSLIDLGDKPRAIITRSKNSINVKPLYTRKGDFFDCNLCKAKFIDRENIVKHIRGHHPEELSRRRSNSKVLMEQKIEFPAREIFKCQVCSCEYDEMSILLNHQKRYHKVDFVDVDKLIQSDKKFKCHWCISAFNYECDLKKHRRVRHSLNLTL